MYEQILDNKVIKGLNPELVKQFLKGLGGKPQLKSGASAAEEVNSTKKRDTKALEKEKENSKEKRSS
jgi:hypothetical protein